MADQAAFRQAYNSGPGVLAPPGTEATAERDSRRHLNGIIRDHDGSASSLDSIRSSIAAYYMTFKKSADMTRDQMTPAIIASKLGHESILHEVYGQFKDSVLESDEDGFTALHWATIGGYLGIIKFLVDHGAQVDATDKSGMTPLMAAAQEGHVAVIERLLEVGADIHIVKRGGFSAMSLAVREGHYAAARLLLERGSDPEIKTDDGWSALYLAANTGSADVVTLLLDYGVDPNDADKRGRTPLISAALRGHADVVELLLRRGADPDAKDGEFKTNVMNLVNIDGDVYEILRKMRYHPEEFASIGPTARGLKNALEDDS